MKATNLISTILTQVGKIAKTPGGNITLTLVIVLVVLMQLPIAQIAQYLLTNFT